MFSSAFVALAIASSVFAAPDPTTPNPSDTYQANGECQIAWTADTNATKPWSTMNIELMTGINSQMTHMRTVATVDATSQTSFSWVCPEFDLYSAVYFYQFSSPADPTNLLWTGRFLIKGPDGSSVSPPLTDPNGVPYGIGHFLDASLYNAMPSYLNGNGQLQGAPGNGTTSSVSSGSPASTSSGAGVSTTPAGTNTLGTSTLNTVTVTSKPTGSASSSTASSTATTSTGGAVGLSSSSFATLLGALMAGVAAWSL